MASLCSCPNAASLSTITDYSCPVKFSEISKIIVCRLQEFQCTVAPSTVAKLGTLAEWTATLAAVDGTKTLVTPTLENVENEPGAPITEEATLRKLVTGYEPTVFTGELWGAPQSTVALFKQLTCEKVLYVMLIDSEGNIIHGLSGTKVYAFKVSNNSFFMQDLEMKKRAMNKNRFGFQLESGWSNTATKTTPIDFDALIDITN